MSSPSAPVIPLIYRAWFLYFDPLISLYTTYACFQNPNFILYSFDPAIPNSASTPPPTWQTRVLLAQLGAGMALIGILSAALPRVVDTAREEGMRVWKVLQVGILVVDVLMGWSYYVAMVGRGEWGVWGAWRGEDWGGWGLTAFVAVLRAAFVAGLGIGEGRKGERKRK